MKTYKDMLREILDEGYAHSDRTGVGTTRIFGYQFRHNMKRGFPLLTTKKIHFHSVIHELLWFIAGDTNIKYLKDNKVRIWNEWADENGDLGPIYGKQWNDFDGVNQLDVLVETIRRDPESRRMVVSAWNPPDVPRMKLPPCHVMFHVVVIEGRLHLQMYQRSADAFLGVPFNIASYALLLVMLAKITGYQPGELIISFGDLHIYNNHHEQVHEQLSRPCRELPLVEIVPVQINSLREFRYEHICLHGYNPHPPIRGDVAV